MRKLKEGKIKEKDRGTLPEPPSELVERNTVAASCNHGDWASTSLLPVSIQTLTHLGLKSIKFSLKHPILSKPQPLLSLWSGSKKGASVWGRDLSWWVTIYCFFFVFAYGFELGMRVATRLRERQRASVEVERLVEAQSGLREWSARESEGDTRLRWERGAMELWRERQRKWEETKEWERLRKWEERETNVEN